MEKLKATLFDPKSITAAGGIVVAIVLVGLVWFVIKGQNTIVGNHINHNTKALIQLEASIGTGNDIQKEQIQVLRELKEVIRYGK